MNAGNKKCARPECGKTVYPIEELKCLDKVFHKGCFKCAVCSMTLNMKNYKGYNKTPYCEAHCPKPGASVVADTPEMRRLAENTKLQSQAKYHEDFEKMKGKKIQIAEDPEIQRHLKNTQVVSNVAYHGENVKRELMERSRPPLEETANKVPVPPPSSSIPTPFAQQPYHQPQQMHHSNQPQPQQQQRYSGGHQHHQQQQPRSPMEAADSPYSHKMQQSSTLIYSSDQGGRVAPQSRPVGSIADYDPMNGQWGSGAASRNNPNYNASRQPQQQHQPTSPQHHQYQSHQPQQQQQIIPGGVGGPHRKNPGTGHVVRALFDYAQADSDEVTFVEGDVIVGCQSVDEGWMTGTVQRTGQWGMLPANYVERVH